MDQSFAQRDTTVGDLRRLSVTLPQAAHVLNVDVRQVRKAIDRHIVTATLITEGKRQIRRLNGVDVFCLRLGKTLEKTIRDEFYSQLQRAPDRQMLSNVLHLPHAGGQQIFPFVFNTAAKTVADIQSLGGASQYINGDGNVRGADVEAHRIASLVGGGMSVDEVLDDYPNLDRAQVDAAMCYAEANPKPGRPFPTRTAKSVLRDGSGGGLAAAFAVAAEDDV